MSLKRAAKERISRFRRKGPTHAKLRDRSASKIASSVLKKAREAMERTEDETARAEMARRIALLERAENSDETQRAEKLKCAADPVYWFNNYVWTYDPRLPQPYVPMVLFEHQIKFIEWFMERDAKREDGIVEKSRDAGATWLTAMFLLHHWIFRHGFKGAVGSRKEDYVDKTGDPDSIFEKLRLALGMIPEWMLPRGLKPKYHFAYLKLINPENGSTITGEAGDNIGRGGRASIYVLDEAAFIQRPQKVEASISHTSDCKIYVSTPNGTGNVFARKRQSGQFPVFTFHWRDDPRKNYWRINNPDGSLFAEGRGECTIEHPFELKPVYPWYAEMERKYQGDPITLAQEVDIDYSASQENVTIPNKWVRAAVGLRLPVSGVIRGSLDISDGGGAKNVLTITHGPVVLAIYDWSQGNTSQTAWKAIQLIERHGGEELIYDSAGGYGSGVKGAVTNSERPVGVNIKGVNVGGRASAERWDDGKAAHEKFTMIKAELWWKLRRRFEKTYEYVELGIDHPLDELISIPNHPELIAQLSQVQHFTTPTGKTVIETKTQLKTRGVNSPDFADSLVLAQARVSTFDVAAGGTASASVTPSGTVNFQGSGAAVANHARRERPIS